MKTVVHAKFETHHPDGWQRLRLRELVAQAQPGFACGERDPEGVVQLRMNNVDTRGNFIWDEFIRVPATPEMVDAYRLRPGDVLFNNTNSVELVGKSALFQGHDEPVVFSNHFTRLRTHEELLAPGFLAAWLNLEWYRGTFASVCNRWIGQSAVKAEKLLSLMFPLPAMSEQLRLVRILQDRLTESAAAHSAATIGLEAAKALKDAYIRKVFSSDNSCGWSKCRLADLILSPIKTGISKPADFASNTNCLTLSAVRNGALVLTANKPVQITEDEARSNWVRPDRFYVVRGNGARHLVGRGAFAPKRVYPSVLYPDLLFEVHWNPKLVHASFLRWAWDSDPVREYIETKARTAAGIYKINQRNLAETPIPVPNLPTQRCVASRLSEQLRHTENVHMCIANQMSMIEALHQSLLQRTFHEEL